jgi:hypothetical protein
LVNEVSAVSNFVYCTSFDALPLSIAVVVAHRGQPECAHGSQLQKVPSSALFLSTSDSTRTVVPVVVAEAAQDHDRRPDVLMDKPPAYYVLGITTTRSALCFEPREFGYRFLQQPLAGFRAACATLSV